MPSIGIDAQVGMITVFDEFGLHDDIEYHWG